jgi:L,D-peptidoglycan transpeptidase YkuD (ErfK/YbiS/YcfS/YnhG family)
MGASMFTISPLALSLALASIPTVRAELVSELPGLRTARQLVIVKTKNWRDLRAAVQLFERSDSSAWRAIGEPMQAVVGWHGMGWGLGLHGSGLAGEPQKAEGDGRSPAGVFRFAEVFGSAPSPAVRFLKLPYRQVTITTEAVDDPRSRFYNRIVETGKVSQVDWGRSEKMARVGGRYHWGIMVEHNWRQMPGRGSCIFIHVWAGPTLGTLGCTALSEPDLECVLRWLDPRAHPLLVQLPQPDYTKLRSAWFLP